MGELEVVLIGGPLDGHARTVGEQFEPAATLVFTASEQADVVYRLADAQYSAGIVRYEYAGEHCTGPVAR